VIKVLRAIKVGKVIMTSETPGEEEISETPDDAIVITTATDLTEAFRNFTNQLTEATQVRARRIQKLVIGLVIGLILDLVLSAGFVYNEFTSRDNQIGQCQQANINRKQDIAIWDTFFNVAAPPAARTTKTRALIAAIDAKVKIKDTTRDCTQVYRFHF
jgi:hypothetical protein